MNIKEILTFEQWMIVGAGIFIVLAFLNALALTKIIFMVFFNKKGNDFSNSSSTKSVKKVEGQNKLKKIVRNILNIPLSIFRIIFVYPFSPEHFSKRWESKAKILFVRLPYKVVWALGTIVVNIGLISMLYFIAQSQFFTYPQWEAVYPLEGNYWDDYTHPIEIEFSVPIDQESLIINMSPDNTGYWEFEKSFSFLPYSRRIKFYPEKTIFPGRDIMIYLTDTSNHYHNVDGGEHLITFNSIYLPEITSSNPENEGTDFPIDQNVVFNLNQKDGQYVDWRFVPDKELEFEVVRNYDNYIELDFANNLNQGETIVIDVYQTPLSFNMTTNEVIEKGEEQKVHTLTFTTVKAPGIASISPEGTGVLIDNVIRVEFDHGMDKNSVEQSFSISPEIEGTITWEGDTVFIFTPANQLDKETHYEFTFAQGMKTSVGGITEAEIKHAFDTIGAVKVVGWSPGNGGSVNSSINVTFDQEVDHASAQSKFSMSPSIAGSFSWSGNTMVYKPSSSMGYSTRYTITISPGVKTVRGLDSRDTFSYAFTTESNVHILNVPLYRQTHAFTCNVTAIAMALAYKGVGASEMSVYNGIAKDNTPCQKSGDTITYWGNPNVGYVGDINGGGTCGGYGVHWGPASGYISSRGVSNQIRSGWNVPGLAAEVEQGHPVVIWWQNGWASPYWKSWGSPSGQVNALNGMHSEVVVGFIGPASNPSHIITNDPWRGRRTLSASYFNSLWGYFNRTGVVIY